MPLACTRSSQSKSLRSTVYDQRDRLVGVTVDPGTGNQVTLTLGSDALGRKIYTRRVATTTVQDVFVHDDWNVIEEWRGSSSTPGLVELSPRQASDNADSYARCAVDCYFGGC